MLHADKSVSAAASDDDTCGLLAGANAGDEFIENSTTGEVIAVA